MAILIIVFVLVFVTALLIGYAIGEDHGRKQEITVKNLFDMAKREHTENSIFYEFVINKSPVSSKAVAFVMRCSVDQEIALEHIKAIKIKKRYLK